MRCLLRLAAVCVALVAVPQALADVRPKAFVDQGVQQCPFAAYTSVQAAVTAVPPGSVIGVCPGQYNEAVLVNKSLTLVGATNGGPPNFSDNDPQEHRQDCGRIPDPLKDAIVTPPAPNQSGFDLAANSIEIRGFTIQGAQGSLSNGGIRARPGFSGYVLARNALRQNSVGMTFASSGAIHSRVVLNCFVNNFDVATGGGLADIFMIAFTTFPTSNTDVDQNYLTGGHNASIQYSGSSPTAFTNVNVERNDIFDGPLVADGATQSSISGNHLFGVFFADSILLGRRNSFLNVIGNSVFFTAAGSGISITGSSNPSHDIRIEGNTICCSAADGITLTGSTHDNTVIANRSGANTRDGIRVGAPSSANVFQQNRAEANGEHDCHDDTSGAGTAGTANTWLLDLGLTQNRPGLCTSP